MGIFSKKEKTKCRFSLLGGVQQFKQDDVVEVFLNDEKQRVELKVVGALTKKEPVFLSYDQIIEVSLVSEKEIIEKSKSVVGRAVAGGVLLGPLGAVVGGMSGVGDKKEEKTSSYIDIKYKDDQSESEIREIFLDTKFATIGWDKFLKTAEEKFNIKK